MLPCISKDSNQAGKLQQFPIDAESYLVLI